MILMKEDTKYRVYYAGSILSWSGAFGLTAVHIILVSGVERAPEDPLPVFQRITSILVLLLIGMAITFGKSLSRLHLARTITEVFRAGMAAAEEAGRNKTHGELSKDRSPEQGAKGGPEVR